MNKTFSNLLKFITVFVGFLSITLPLHYYYKDTPLKREFKAYSTKLNKTVCSNSPHDKMYQQCVQRKVVHFTNIASPIEIIDIHHLLTSLYQQDLFHEVFPKEDILIAYIDNQIIFWNSLLNFTVDRQSIDYFQLLIFPYIKWQLSNELEKTKGLVSKAFKKLPQTSKSEKLIQRAQELDRIKIGF